MYVKNYNKFSIFLEFLKLFLYFKKKILKKFLIVRQIGTFHGINVMKYANEC